MVVCGVSEGVFIGVFVYRRHQSATTVIRGATAAADNCRPRLAASADVTQGRGHQRHVNIRGNTGRRSEAPSVSSWAGGTVRGAVGLRGTV